MEQTQIRINVAKFLAISENASPGVLQYRSGLEAYHCLYHFTCPPTTPRLAQDYPFFAWDFLLAAHSSVVNASPLGFLGPCLTLRSFWLSFQYPHYLPWMRQSTSLSPLCDESVKPFIKATVLYGLALFANIFVSSMSFPRQISGPEHVEGAMCDTSRWYNRARSKA